MGSEIALIPEVGKEVESIVGGVVQSFVEAIKSGNSTKVALAKIDAEMQIAITTIIEKSKNSQLKIQSFAALMSQALDKTDMSFSQKQALISELTEKMLRI